MKIIQKNKKKNNINLNLIYYKNNRQIEVFVQLNLLAAIIWIEIFITMENTLCILKTVCIFSEKIIKLEDFVYTSHNQIYFLNIL